jgi:hypothetical protein
MIAVYNKTGAPIVLSGLAVTVPASAAAPARGAGVNVTSELRGLTLAQYAALEAQRGTSLDYEWTTAPEYSTGGLVTSAPEGEGLLPTALFWAGVTGDDTKDGLSQANAVKTGTRLARIIGSKLPRAQLIVSVLEATDPADMVQINAAMDTQGALAPDLSTNFGTLQVPLVFQGQRTIAAFVDPNTASTTLLTMTTAAIEAKVTATTIAVASNGAVLPQATINVASTAGFPASGLASVETSLGPQTVAYTSLTGLTLDGCTGGFGTMSTGGEVNNQAPQLIQVTGFDFAPHVGRMVQIMSSTPAAALDAIAMITDAPFLGTAWLQSLNKPVIGAQGAPITAANMPVNGSTFRIYTTTVWGCPMPVGHIDGGLGNMAVALVDLEFSSATRQVARGAHHFFQGCIFRRVPGFSNGSEASGLNLFSSCGLVFAAPAAAFSTTIAAASNGAVLPQATINVAATAAFPTAGAFVIVTDQGLQFVTYTGKGATTFTGCAGGTGTMSTGGAVRVDRTPTQIAFTAGDSRFHCCAFLNCDIRPREADGRATMINCLMVGGSYHVAGPGDLNRSGPIGAVLLGAGVGDFGLGVYRWPHKDALGPSPATVRGTDGAAVHLGHGCTFSSNSRFYGQNATIGTAFLVVKEKSSFLPTDRLVPGVAATLASPNPAQLTRSLVGVGGGIAGVGGQFLIDDQTAHFTEADLDAALGGVPKVRIAATTWKDWNDPAKFNRRLVSLRGSSITSIES